MILLFAAATAAALAPPDFRRVWACSSRSEFDGNSAHVIRELDKAGAQLSVSVQWSVHPKRMFSAGLFGMVDRKGAGDPPLRAGSVLVNWTGRVAEGVDTASPVVVLHLKNETPRRAEGRPQIPRTDGTFSAEVPWPRVIALSRRADRAEISLVNARGQAIASSRVELRQVRRALAAVEEALRETRWQLAAPNDRCEPITEYLTF